MGLDISVCKLKKKENEQFVNTIYNSINCKLTPKEEDMLQKFIEY